MTRPRAAARAAAQPVALGLDAAERAAQLPAHPVEVVRERAELVAEAVVQRRLEVAERDRLGRERTAGAAAARSAARAASPTRTPITPAITPARSAWSLTMPIAVGDVGPRAERDERAAPCVAGAPTTNDPAVRRACAEVASPASARALHAPRARDARRPCARARAPSASKSSRSSCRCARASRRGRRAAPGVDVLRGRVRARRARALRAWPRNAFSERSENCDDDDRGRGRGHDGERGPEPPANADEAAGSCRNRRLPGDAGRAIRSIGRRSGSRCSSAQRVEVETPHPRAAVKRLAERLDGRRLESVEAVGKNLLLRSRAGSSCAATCA